MIISTEAGKASEKNSTSFNKTLKKVGIEGTQLNIIKAIYEKPAANIILNCEKLKAFPVKSGKDKDAHSCHFYSTQYWKSQPQQSDKKKVKGIQVGKEELKLSLFADDMTLYIENPKDTTKKLLELINKFDKVAG